ncbi:MAG TPA: carboxypeptidase-like regulatory domain-containing protein [Bryobacteraceae bacterium]|nr:carboxypeptidase-like regulatory domain-containing protein [Bryobacteraceae bacterium]
MNPLRIISVCLLAAAPCLGQAGRTELFGTVTDPSGLVVAGARLEAAEQATMARFASVSDSHGEHHLLGLPAGHYVLSVEKPGFQTYLQSGITLRIADRTVLDVRLAVGQPSQFVEVHAAAPMLQTAGGDVSYTVDQTKVAALPLDGRNFIPLIALSPGVALPAGSLLPRINGSRPRTNEYVYDGISVLQPEPGQVAFYPLIDAIEEFRLNINAYAPEYGRSNGGAVIVSSRSGGNQFHGTVFEFLRNEDLNARNYFAQGGARPEFRRNQYGFVLGGPIRKNRTFFFVDWQGTRLRTGITRFSTVPTPAERQGVFAVPVYDPATSPRQLFPNNTIPASRFDPLALEVLAHYPLPNLAARPTITRARRPNRRPRTSSTRAWTVISAPGTGSSPGIPSCTTRIRR